MLLSPRLILITASLIGALSARVSAQTVSFKQAAPEVGLVRKEKTTGVNDLDLNITVNGQLVQSGKQKTEEVCEKSVEILAVSGGKATRLRVRYLKLTSAQETKMTGRETESDPLEGKSFILEKKGAEVLVTDGQGGKVDALTADAVLSQESDIFDDDPSQLSSILPRRPIRIGETLQVDPAKAKAIFNSGFEELKVERMSLVLKERSELEGVRVAVFIVRLKGLMEPQGTGSRLDLNLTGRILVGIDSLRPYQIEMEGPVRFRQNQGGTIIDGSGTTSTKVSARYSMAKSG